MVIQLHYEEKGTGFPLILLHGNGEDLTYFRHQMEYFSKSYRVVAIDTRGHGKSPRGTADFTISQFAEDLKAFLDDHGIEKAHILGFSDGGNIALTFALRYPGYIHRLILNGANLYPSGMKFPVRLPVILEYYLTRFRRQTAKHERMALMVEEPNIQPDELHQLTMPTLVIAGTRDMIKDSHTRLMAKHLPKGELVLLEGDHFIANKEPGPFNAAAAAFLERGEP